MDHAKLYASSSEIQQRTVMHYRVIIACILVSIACLLWLAAFWLFDTMSQKDPWFAYTHWHTRVFCSAVVVLSFVSAALIRWFRFLPGRPIAALIIGIIAATLILPVADMGSGKRREMVSRNRFYRFSETTKQYIAFAVPVIIGCTIASARRREPISEQNAEPELLRKRTNDCP